MRHREGAGGALTGGYREFRLQTLNTPHGNDRCIRSFDGTTSSPDMFEFEFDPPVGHWGGHAFDLESHGSTPGVLRAYDDTDTLIYERPILFPNNDDGELTVNYIGLVSTAANIARVTVQVGANSTGPVANDNSMSFTDIRYGPATMRPGQLSTTFANNKWLATTSGGVIYVDVECLATGGVTIDELDLNFHDDASTTGTIDIYAKPAGDTWSGVSFWAGPLASGSASAAGPGLPTRVTLSSGIELGAGCSYQLAIVANGLQHAYTEHAQVPITYENAALRVTTQRSAVSLGATFVFEPRVANIRLYYTPGGNCPDFATVSQIGDGCVVAHSSIYEQFAGGTFDLANTSMMYAPLPGSDGVALVHDPAGTLLPYSTASANQLSLGDDDQVAVTSLTGPSVVLPIVVGSNGWVVPEGGGGNSNSFSPSVTTLLSNPRTAFYSWKDLNPAAPGGGRVYYEESSAGPLIRGIVTFDGVYQWNTSDANTVQFVCDFVSVTNGSSTSYDLLQVAVIWGAINGDPPLVGYSPGGSNADPGSHDLSAITTTSQTDAQDRRLGLRPVQRPAQQASPYAFNVTTTGIPDSSPFSSGLLFHVGIVSVVNPNLPLDTIGIPGCWLYASLDVLQLQVITTGANHTWNVLDVPDTSVNLSGFTFYAQSAVLGTTNNAFLGWGALTSNGLECTVGGL